MKILIVEDELTDLQEVRGACSPQDSVETAGTLREAASSLEKTWPEVVIADAIFPTREAPNHLYLQFNVDALLDEIRRLQPGTAHPRSHSDQRKQRSGRAF